MRRALHIFALFAVTIILCLPNQAPAETLVTNPGFTEQQITTPDGQRSYAAYIPVTLTAAKAPLVIILHGAGGSGAQAIEQGHWALAADRYGFVILAPDGLLEFPDRRASLLRNPRTWNAAPDSRTWAAEAGIDDIGFLSDLVDLWVAQGGIDARRVYVTGFSNGAALAFRAGAELSDRVAAIAPVSNALLVPVERLDRPVPLLLIWGDADPINPVLGGEVTRRGATVTQPSATASLATWADLLNCKAQPDSSITASITILQYQDCAAGSEALFYQVAGLGHQWPGGEAYATWLSGPGSDTLDATALIWEFFARHARDG